MEPAATALLQPEHLTTFERALQSPVAVALILVAVVIYLVRELKQQRAREEARAIEAQKRDDLCVARIREVEKRYTDYLENQGVKQTEAIARNTVAIDNHAAQLERNTRATEAQTTAFARSTNHS